METERLIEVLGAHAEPVRPLAPVSRRLLAWFVPAALAVAVVVAVVGARPDLVAKFAQPDFAIPQGAALATAILAAFAALSAGLPDGRRWVLWLPLVPLTVWLGNLGHQCWWDWMRSGFTSLPFGPDYACIPGIALVGLVPAALMVAMLRRGAPFHRRATIMSGILAATALADFGLRLFHPVDAAAMVLVWQIGSVAVFTLLAGLVRL